MNAVQAFVRPVDGDFTTLEDGLIDGPPRDPRWRLKVLGMRLSLSAMRVTGAMHAAAAGEPGAIARWNDAIDQYEQLRAEYRAQIEVLTGLSADLIERGLAL